MLWRKRLATPAVSIVIATYNRAALLPQAIDSALAQEYADLEVLVIDDGSTDETAEVLASYGARCSPERFRFHAQANAGQARALNRGYQLARGELLAYMCDDDLFDPTLVSTLARALVRRPDAAAAYPGYRLIEADGTVADTWLPLPYTTTTALTHHDTIIGPCGLARRAALEASGGWDPQYKWAGDFIMWMGVAQWGPVIRVDQPLASWRKHGSALTSVIGPERAAEMLRMLEHGLGLDSGVAEDRGLRALALHSTCAEAAWYAGHTEFGPGEPITMIDLDRPLISAWASGQDVDTLEFDQRRAAAVAGALRSLGELTLELAEARDGGAGRAPAGYERAVQRLQAVGALAGSQGERAPLDAPGLGPALVDAALDCRLDAPAAALRFLVPDRHQSAVVAEELQALVGLTLSGPAQGPRLLDAIQAEIAQRRRDLAAAGIVA